MMINEESYDGDIAKSAAWTLVGTFTCMLVRDFSAIISITAQESDNGPHWVVMFKHSAQQVAFPIPIQVYTEFAESFATVPSDDMLERRSNFMEQHYHALQQAVSDIEDDVIENSYD